MRIHHGDTEKTFSAEVAEDAQGTQGYVARIRAPILLGDLCESSASPALNPFSLRVRASLVKSGVSP
jgi:hypothetical protein